MSKVLFAENIPTAAAPPATSPSSAGLLVSLALAVLLSSLGTSIANVGLPTLAGAFTATMPEVQWVVIVYLVALTTLSISGGRIGDLLGRRRVLLTGIALFTFASLLCGLAPTLPLLIAARGAQGVGAAMMLALTMALIGETIPRENTGRAMGLLGTMSATGTALGPSLGGLLIAGVGWRAIFLINLPLGALTLFLAHRHVPVACRRPGTPRAGLDPLGTLVLALTIGAYAFAMTLGRGHFGPLNGTLLVAAAGGIGVFVLVERRASSPLLRLEMLRTDGLRAGLVMSALVSTVLMASLVVGPFYLSRALGLNAAAVGLMMSAGPFVAALTAAPAGRLVDHRGAPFATQAGLVTLMMGAVLLAVTPIDAGILGYVLPLVILTVGYALFQTANNTAVLTGAGPEQRGVTSGLLNLARNLGLVTGASVMGAVFAFGSGTTEITAASPAAVVTGLRWTFAVASGLIVLALMASISSRTRAAGVE